MSYSADEVWVVIKRVKAVGPRDEAALLKAPDGLKIVDVKHVERDRVMLVMVRA